MFFDVKRDKDPQAPRGLFRDQNKEAKMGAPDSWADGISSGAYKSRGKQKKSRQKNGKTPRTGIRKKRMARRRKL